MQQIWKDVKGYQNVYQVSNYGRVKSLNYNRTGKEKIIKHRIKKIKCKNRIYKSHQIGLHKDGKVKCYCVNRLVYEAFKGKITDNYQIDHINNNPQDNRLDNLQLLTKSENSKKRFKDNPNLNVGSSKRKILCLNNNTVYDSVCYASRKLNLYQSNITHVLKGKQKHTHGYRFQYLLDDSAINNNTLIQMELF